VKKKTAEGENPHSHGPKSKIENQLGERKKEIASNTNPSLPFITVGVSLKEIPSKIEKVESLSDANEVGSMSKQAKKINGGGSPRKEKG